VRFKSSAHLDLVAPILVEMLKLPREPRETIGTYRKLLIEKMCRELEKLIRIDKSKAAQQIALAMGLERDLSEYSWAERARLEDAGSKQFHFEHTETVYELARSLNEIAEPTVDAVASVLARARVTWITTAENDRLDRQFKSRRPDWREAYRHAGIEIIEIDETEKG